MSHGRWPTPPRRRRVRRGPWRSPRRSRIGLSAPFHLLLAAPPKRTCTLFKSYSRRDLNSVQVILERRASDGSGAVVWACGQGLADLDRKSTRLNSSHTVIYTLSLHDALPI